MLDYGRFDFDRRHVLVTSHVWQLPSLKNGSRLVRGAAGNWEVSGASATAPCVNHLIRSAFALPATGGFGNVGKGLLSGPGLCTSNPVTTVSAAGFGSILGAGDPRIAQMALKITF